MPNPTDQDRLEAKTKGATIFDFAAHRAAAIQAGALRTTETYSAPGAMFSLGVLVFVVLFALYVFARR